MDLQQILSAARKWQNGIPVVKKADLFFGARRAWEGKQFYFTVNQECGPSLRRSPGSRYSASLRSYNSRTSFWACCRPSLSVLSIEYSRSSSILVRNLSFGRPEGLPLTRPSEKNIIELTHELVAWECCP
jgi:hypothetical protein